MLLSRGRKLYLFARSEEFYSCKPFRIRFLSTLPCPACLVLEAQDHFVTVRAPRPQVRRLLLQSFPKTDVTIHISKVLSLGASNTCCSVPALSSAVFVPGSACFSYSFTLQATCDE